MNFLSIRLRKFILFLSLTTFITLLTTMNTTHAAVLLKMNAKGSSVTTLQQRLTTLNYITAIDGVFGIETHRAVIAFQRDNQLNPTGIVDTKTWNTIKNQQPSLNKSNKKDSPKKHAPSPAPIPSIELNQKTSPTAAAIIRTAKKYTGTPYVFGGTTPKGFDCSGYLQYIFVQHGIKIPRAADEQYKIGTTIARNKLIAGDLVFFNTDAKGISHCGLYIGNGNFIHASSSKGVRIDELNNSYWKTRYSGAKRILK